MNQTEAALKNAKKKKRLPVLLIDSVTPATGAIGGGATVIITGAGFDTRTVVKFHDGEVTSLSVMGAGKIICKAPAHAAGKVNVTVVRGDASAILTDGFEYTG